MVQGYQILYPVTTRFLVGIWSALFYNLCDLIIIDCCNIRIIETKFGAPGNRTPLPIIKKVCSINVYFISKTLNKQMIVLTTTIKMNLMTKILKNKHNL